MSEHIFDVLGITFNWPIVILIVCVTTSFITGLGFMYIMMSQNAGKHQEIDNFTKSLLLKMIKGSITINPSPINLELLNQDNQTEKLKKKGKTELKNKKYRMAIHYFTIAISSCPNENDDLLCRLYTNRASAYIKLHNYESTVIDCNFALGIRPYYCKALFLRGKSAAEMGHLKWAVNDFHIVHFLDGRLSQSELTYIQNLKNELDSQNNEL